MTGPIGKSIQFSLYAGTITRTNALYSAVELPWDVQLTGLRLIEGFENVRIFRPGYAIEYDYFPPINIR